MDGLDWTQYWPLRQDRVFLHWCPEANRWHRECLLLRHWAHQLQHPWWHRSWPLMESLPLGLRPCHHPWQALRDAHWQQGCRPLPEWGLDFALLPEPQELRVEMQVALSWPRLEGAGPSGRAVAWVMAVLALEAQVQVRARARAQVRVREPGVQPGRGQALAQVEAARQEAKLA